MRVEIVRGDITTEHVDAIVNAANSSMLGGGGVDGAIHRAAGRGLLDECRRVVHRELPGYLPVGQAVATGAYQLPARWVIHTVGPNATRGETDPALLESCYRESLRVAAELGAASVAFPAISAGVYGWAPDDAARCAARGVRQWRDEQAQRGEGADAPELVRMVLFSNTLLAAFLQAFADERLGPGELAGQ